MSLNILTKALRVNKLTSNLFRNVQAVSHKRSLYSGEFLGMDIFLPQREKMVKMFSPNKSEFLTKMENNMISDNKVPVYTDDLKCMTYLTTGEEAELDLLMKMVKKFVNQNSEMRFGSFIFGPVIIRQLYTLNKPDHIFDLLMSKDTKQFFHQFSTFIVGMDLLFESGEYEKVLQLADKLEQLQIQGQKYPRDPSVLAAASCLKLNTPESFSHLKQLLENIYASQIHPSGRLITTLAALSLKQGDPDTAMSLIGRLEKESSVQKNLKLEAMVLKKQIVEAIELMQSVLSQDLPFFRKRHHAFLRETVDNVKKALEKMGSEEKMKSFNQLVASLQENDYILDKSLDDIILGTIQKRIPRDQNGSFGSNSNERRPRTRISMLERD